MFTHVLRRFLPSAVAITLLTVMVYVVAQQVYRVSANDPQERIASDTMARIVAGEKPDVVVSAVPIDIAKNAGVFTVVYNSAGKPLAGAITLDGAPTAVPMGAITYALTHGFNRVTWQPRAGVREAMVLYKVDSTKVVAVGQSLAEAERRVSILGEGVAFGWVVSMLVTFLAVAVGERHGKE